MIIKKVTENSQSKTCCVKTNQQYNKLQTTQDGVLYWFMGQNLQKTTKLEVVFQFSTPKKHET